MKSLKERMSVHVEKIKAHQEMEAALAGVFTQEAEAAREKFQTLVAQVIKPAFEEFKAALRELGRDAVIVTNLDGGSTMSILLTLCDRHLKLGPGKTIKLVNPKTDMTKVPNAKYYTVYMADHMIKVGQKVASDLQQITTDVNAEDITPEFLENELGGFFERAYPTPLPQ